MGTAQLTFDGGMVSGSPVLEPCRWRGLISGRGRDMLKFGLVAIWIALLAVVLSSVIRSEKVELGGTAQPHRR